ncbi:MAG: MOSC domain-containing protein [Campylobacterales bacterium]|nr:MOSC domain-containing protein [Campylobacterales bacterium]
MKPHTTIKAIYCGQVNTMEHKSKGLYNSAYKKQQMPSDKKLFINAEGFLDDSQGDRENHGGIDKAVCVYSQKAYDFLQKEHNISSETPLFGENITIVDLDDSEVCIGDIFECGEVLFEVSQPRQPCWKISTLTGIKNLTALLVKEHKSGFYMRVLQEGKISQNDTLQLISRDYPQLTIEYVNRCSFDAKKHQKEIPEILACSKLSEAYKESLHKRYKGAESGLQEWQNDLNI